MKRSIPITIAAAAALLLSLPMLAQPHSHGLEEIRGYYFDGQFAAVIGEFWQMAPEERQRPQVSFWVGQSYLRRHDYKTAEPFLRQALAGKLPPQQHDACENALQRIEVLKRLCPPALTEFKAAGNTITIFAQPTQWSKTVAGQMPVFLARAKEAFGESSTHINFYLFEDRKKYDQFFGAWTIKAGQSDLHRGTGGTGLVEFCEYFPNGQKIGADDVNVLFARVLHEYSHALCHTIYGDTWAITVPQWLNEGMADYFGAKYNPKFSLETEQKMTQVAKSNPPPSYEVMTRQMHSLSFGYTVADAMVNELFAGKDVSVFADLIRLARKNGGNFEAALKRVTGKDPRAAYAQIVQKYWGRGQT